MLVVDGDRLVGVVTCDGLVERVVAAGRDPRVTALGDVAEPVAFTALPDMPVEDAYRLMEVEDVERLPVTEDGRLVGVLSRSALTRRLAEDEPPAADAEAARGLSVGRYATGFRLDATFRNCASVMWAESIWMRVLPRFQSRM